MANMQKNGTYSGGAAHARRRSHARWPARPSPPSPRNTSLYTKITGGQRIDLFGAQLHELPDIWEALIAAGFETGHAYGKATRTVKSCVGSTWCRYGVQDSVKMALDIENRYKGLRAPHKLKFAVSGCTRECAEAQSKDVGVIATEKGWNLYVCGNGGVRPRHAELFATDLDDATLIRYIDRLLMFYIRTADKLQRTSVWRDSLEGGLDYLKAVIIGDSLGLGAPNWKRRCNWWSTATNANGPNALEGPGEAQALPHLRQRPAGRSRHPASSRSAASPGRRRRAPHNPRHSHRRGNRLMNASDNRNASDDGGAGWRPVCDRRDLVGNSGVVALVDDAQVALFYLPGHESQPLYAIDNRDPKSGANVLGRGIVGHLGGELVVASPLYKQHFRLARRPVRGISRTAAAHLAGALSRATRSKSPDGRRRIHSPRPNSFIHIGAATGNIMSYLAPSEFVTKMVDAGESKASTWRRAAYLDPRLHGRRHPRRLPRCSPSRVAGADRLALILGAALCFRWASASCT